MPSTMLANGRCSIVSVVALYSAATLAAAAVALLVCWAVGTEEQDDARSTLAWSSAFHPVTVCLQLGQGIYDTRHVHQIDAYMYMATGLAIDDGPCNCGLLCLDFHSFRTTGHRCTCQEDATIADEAPKTTAAAASAAETSSTQQQRKLLFDDFFDDHAIDLSMCTRLTDQCSTERRCPFNQACRAPTSGSSSGRCQCEPVPCVNRFGNPCGPDGACRDTPTGYVCETILNSCPMGCGPNSKCLPAMINESKVYSCSCNTGFVRLAPHLACTLAPVTPQPAATTPATAAPMRQPSSPQAVLPSLQPRQRAPQAQPANADPVSAAPTVVPQSAPSVASPATIAPTPLAPTLFPVGGGAPNAPVVVTAPAILAPLAPAPQATAPATAPVPFVDAPSSIAAPVPNSTKPVTPVAPVAPVEPPVAAPQNGTTAAPVPNSTAPVPTVAPAIAPQNDTSAAPVPNSTTPVAPPAATPQNGTTAAPVLKPDAPNAATPPPSQNGTAPVAPPKAAAPPVPSPKG